MVYVFSMHDLTPSGSNGCWKNWRHLKHKSTVCVEGLGGVDEEVVHNKRHLEGRAVAFRMIVM